MPASTAAVRDVTCNLRYADLRLVLMVFTES